MLTLYFDLVFGTRGVARRCAWPFAALLRGLAVCGIAHAQVISYEGVVAPEPSPWQRIATSNVERSLKSGWLTQVIEGEETDLYQCSIGDIGGLVGRFFVEWRAITDNPSWLIDQWQVPAVVAASGKAASLYHTVFTESAVAFLRDVSIPRVIVPISVGDPHTYRVEVFAHEYVWYVDGVVANTGIPEGPYPDPNAFLIWGIEIGRAHV